MARPDNNRTARLAIIAALVVVVLGVVVAYLATRGGCTPGSTRACDCGGGRSATAMCMSSGREYSPCACGEASVDAGVPDGAGSASGSADGGGAATGGATGGGGEPNAAGTGAQQPGSGSGATDDAGAATGATSSSDGTDGGVTGAAFTGTDGSAASGSAAQRGTDANGPVAGATDDRPGDAGATGTTGGAPRYCSAWSGSIGSCARCVMNFNFSAARAGRDVFVGTCDRMGRGTVEARLLVLTTQVRDRGAGNAVESDWQLSVNDAPPEVVQNGPHPLGAAQQATARLTEFRGGPVRVRVRLTRCAAGADTACTGTGSLVINTR